MPHSINNEGILIDSEDDFKKSPEWIKVATAHLQTHPYCLACGCKPVAGELTVHNKYPYQLCNAVGRPDLACDERNLITFCDGIGSEEHHLLLGHLGDWSSYNPEAITDATTTFFQRKSAYIRSNEVWLAKRHNKPSSLEDMSESEINTLKTKLDLVYPRKVLVDECFKSAMPVAIYK